MIILNSSYTTKTIVCLNVDIEDLKQLSYYLEYLKDNSKNHMFHESELNEKLKALDDIIQEVERNA